MIDNGTYSGAPHSARIGEVESYDSSTLCITIAITPHLNDDGTGRMKTKENCACLEICDFNIRLWPSSLSSVNLDVYSQLSDLQITVLRQLVSVSIESDQLTVLLHSICSGVDHLDAQK